MLFIYIYLDIIKYIMYMYVYMYTYTYMHFIKNKKALHTRVVLRESFFYMLFLM